MRFQGNRTTGFGAGMAMLFGCLASLVSAQEYQPTTQDPPTADYEIQGEYFGKVEATGAKIGAHIVARGSSRFDVVILPGGLLSLSASDPNGGWDGKTRYTATGITLSGTTFSASITGGATAYVLTTITGTGPNRVLNGTAAGNAFALTRKTGPNGTGGERQSPTLGLRPEGKTWSTGFQSWFVDGRKATQAEATADLTKWKTRDNGVQLKYGNFLYRGVQSSGSHGSCFLHIEFRSPYQPSATGQNRGNSGIYLRGMHEQQVLDSFGQPGKDDDYGSVYKVKVASVNAALPPLTWHTYDIYYTAGTGTNGTFTTYANGVKVQENTPVSVITEAGFNGSSVYLQNHGNEVIYNNIWIIPNATTTTLPYDGLLGTVSINLQEKTNKLSLRRGDMKLSAEPTQFFDVTGKSLSRGLKNSDLPILYLSK
jgi:Domain of Unknown Function (DUF1080)